MPQILSRQMEVESKDGVLSLFPKREAGRARFEKRRAVFLDRDGILNRLVFRSEDGSYDSPYRLDELALVPEAPGALERLKGAGLGVVVVSNQPGVAKGKCDLPFLILLTERLTELLSQGGGGPDGLYYCLHHPEATVEALRSPCSCRKPQPGLLRLAARDFDIDLVSSYLVGDNATDIQAGQEAGCKTYLVCGPGTRSHLLDPALEARCRVVGSLGAAVEEILRDVRGGNRS